MCGILGYYSKDKPVNLDFIKVLLDLNESRGHHATGIYAPDVGIYKKAITASKFILDPELDKYANSNIVLGHTRFGTLGDNYKDKNAHPFESGKIVGIHNGMISNHAYLKSTYGLPEYEVDSEVIFSLIDKVGVEEAVKKLSGSFAIAFYNKEDGTFSLFRHSNPCYVSGDYRNGDFYFSSMPAKFQMSYYLKEDTLYKFKDGLLIENKELEVLRPTYQSYNYLGTRHYYNQDRDDFYYNKPTKKANDDLFFDALESFNEYYKEKDFASINNPMSSPVTTVVGQNVVTLSEEKQKILRHLLHTSYALASGLLEREKYDSGACQSIMSGFKALLSSPVDTKQEDVAEPTTIGVDEV